MTWPEFNAEFEFIPIDETGETKGSRRARLSKDGIAKHNARRSYIRLIHSSLLMAKKLGTPKSNETAINYITDYMREYRVNYIELSRELQRDGYTGDIPVLIDPIPITEDNLGNIKDEYMDNGKDTYQLGEVINTPKLA